MASLIYGTGIVGARIYEAHALQRGFTQGERPERDRDRQIGK